MRTITEKSIEAFMSGTKLTIGNTRVQISDCEYKTVWLKLHDNLIATRVGSKIRITNCGWFTNTTKERLNALPGVHIQQKAGKWYLNGIEWDGTWIEVK